MKTLVFASAIMIGGASLALGQTVTVSKSGTPDFATIQAALNSFNPDPNPSLDNVIQILDDSLYDEAISVNVPVTIEGVGANRPIIAAQAAATQVPGDGGGTDGLVVFLSAPGEVTLRNFILIPSSTNTPADDLLRTGGTDLTINLENLLITSNNGANQPVSTDGLSLQSTAGAILIGDDGAFLAGTGLVATLTDVVITHALNTGTGRDGLVCSAVAQSITIGDGCVFSFNGRLGIQAHASQSFVIDAPNDPVIVTGNAGFAGIWFAGAQSVERSINGAVVTSNTGFGIENQNRGTITGTISNAIIANNGNHGLVIGAVGTGNTNVSNVTIANNTGQAVLVAPVGAGTEVAQGNLNIVDSIIAGQNGSGTFTHNGVGTATISNSALVAAGAFRLAVPPVVGTGTTNQSGITTENPNFAQTNNISNLVTFYQVTSPAYETAGTGGSELSGGGTYELIEEPTSAQHWSVYR